MIEMNILTLYNSIKIIKFYLSLLLILLIINLIHGNDNEVKMQWTVLNYTWDSDHSYGDYIQTKKFIPQNCALAGINIDKNENIYVTVPRWTEGVPGTLNKVEKQNNGEYLLSPYPSWESQEEGVIGKIQNVLGLTINTKTNTMWVLDVGRRNFLRGESNDTSHPTIWFINLDDNTLQGSYTIPETCISYTESFLNDIALDQDDDIAYLTDAYGKGAIIVYDKNSNTCRSYSGVSTENDPSYTMIINGINYGNDIFTTPIDGITITEDYQAIFYTQVQGTTLYRLSTSFLKSWLNDASINNEYITNEVEKVGEKLPSDGIKYLSGWLYWGALTSSTIYYLNIDATSEIDNDTMNSIMHLKTNTKIMHWVDTFCIDLVHSRYLWYVSNKLDLFINETMNFEDSTANFRIVRLDTKAEDPEITPSHVVTMIIISFVIFAVFIGCTILTIFFYWRIHYINQQKYHLIYNIDHTIDNEAGVYKKEDTSVRNPIAI